MANVYILEAANLFAGDADADASNHLTLQSLKLPGLEENFSDHTPGGAALGVEFETHMNKLEATFNLVGFNPQVMGLLGRWSAERQHFTALGVVRDRLSGKALKAEAIMYGRLGRANPTEFRRGDLMAHEYAIKGITFYKLSLEGELLFHWDFFTNTRIIGGVDVNARVNDILGIGRSPVAAPNGVEQT